jgi:hypothetical protein
MASLENDKYKFWLRPDRPLTLYFCHNLALIVDFLLTRADYKNIISVALTVTI